MDKLNSQKTSDPQIADNCGDSENMVTEGHDVSRRKFTRNVLVGSAVLLTLGNRAAWGASSACISPNVWASYTEGGTPLASFNPEQQADIIEYESHLSQAQPGNPQCEEGLIGYKYNDN